MKSFRYYLTSLMMALVLGLSLTACDEESQAQTNYSDPQSQQPTQIVNVPEINKKVKDSLDKYTARIDSISKDTKDAVDTVSAMQKNVSNLQGHEMWWWISLGITTLSLILALIGIKLCVSLQGRANRQRRDIDNIVREKREASFNTRATTTSKSSTPSDYEFLKKRVSELEYQVRQLTAATRSTQPYTQPVPNPVIPEVISKNGYFANPIQASEPYFRKLLSSRDSEARFSVEIQGEKGYFKPLDDSSSYLFTLVSNDAMKSAIEFSGCQPPSEATSMRIITPGEAVQKDGRWYITKKASVALSR